MNLTHSDGNSSDGSSSSSSDEESSSLLKLHRPKFLKLESKETNKQQARDDQDRELKQKIREVNSRLDVLEYNGLNPSSHSTNEQYVHKLLSLKDCDSGNYLGGVGNANEHNTMKEKWTQRKQSRMDATKKKYIAKQLEVEKIEESKVKAILDGKDELDFDLSDIEPMTSRAVRIGRKNKSHAKKTINEKGRGEN